MPGTFSIVIAAAVFCFVTLARCQQQQDYDRCKIDRHPPRGFYADASSAAIVDTNVAAGTTIFFICRNPYELFDGPDSATCQIDGTWRPELAQLGKCRRLTIGQVTTTTTRTTTRTTTTVRTTTRPAIATSLAPSFTCTLPTIENGDFASTTTGNGIIGGRWVRPGGRVVLFCHDGSPVVGGSSTASCKRNLEWSDVFGRCSTGGGTGSSITCAGRIEVANGRVTGTGNRPNDWRRLDCYTGFQLIGARDIVCQSDGQWSSDIGQCVSAQQAGKLCEPFPQLENAVVRGEQMAYVGEIRQVVCTEHHRFEPVASSTDWASPDKAIRCGSDGKWSTWLGKCVAYCDTLPTIKGGHITSGSNEVDAIRNIICDDPSQTIIGNSFITCCWNGQWSPNGQCYDKRTLTGESQIYLERQSSGQCPPTPQDLTYCPGWSRLFSTDCNNRTKNALLVQSSSANEAPILSTLFFFFTMFASTIWC